MDGRGRLAQPVKGSARWRSRLPGRTAMSVASSPDFDPADHQLGSRTMRGEPRFARRSRLAHVLDRWSSQLDSACRAASVSPPPAPCSRPASATAPCGAVMCRRIVAAMKDARDAAANAAGFRIVSVALAGNRQVTREEVLAAAGITGTTSLVFLDVEQARERLKSNPWIADATVLKLYPGELQIGIKEREAFALWQKDGKVSVDRRRRHRARALCGAAPRPAAAGGRQRRRGARQGFPGAARSLSRDPRSRARVGAGRRAALEPAAQRTASTCACRKWDCRPRSSGSSCSTARRT